MTLGIVITGISAWWVSTILKEGNKALKESKTKIRQPQLFPRYRIQGIFREIPIKINEKLLHINSEGVKKNILQTN